MITRLLELRRENQQAAEAIKMMGGADPELIEAFSMLARVILR